ncbi:MAG: type III-B CRISPR module-associated protein Cmr5 [Nitrospinae bacterium]|nr:type III-B CRISPR module-associated protein Cmr5 [Nitrospinota bacterium]MBF0633511.1 type III-B CRISPR module-associated protein Cmr5 [Nitrospinota bacterium]
MNQTLDQERAAHSWGIVQNVKRELAPQDQKKFGGQAKKLPIRIMSAGLGSSLAFLEAKKYAPKLLDALSEWTKKKMPGADAQMPLLARIMKNDANFLRRATDETLAYLQWLNRFAEAEGITEDNDNTN